MKLRNYLALLFIAVAILFSLPVYAQDDDSVEVIDVEEELLQGDTIIVFSEAMQRDIKSTVIVPSQYFEQELQDETYPVIYLLNGYGGGYKDWSNHKNLDEIANDMGVIFVCPDGQNSWYWDSPIRKDMQFETYIIRELVPYIDENYRTIANPKMRAITGLSMGGHGALWLAFRHPETFNVVGCMSGGVNILPFPNNWKMKELIGEYETNKEVWEQHTAINLVPNLENGVYKIIVDCGSKDFFAKVNDDLHQALLDKGIDHDYISRPGIHNWDYWVNSLDYQLLFFQKAFDANSADSAAE